MKKVLPLLMPVFRSILFVLGGCFLAAITGKTPEETAKWWPILFTISNIITIFILLIVCKAEGFTFAHLINPKKQPVNLKQIILTVLIMLITGIGGMIGFALLFFGGEPSFLTQPIPIWVAAINLILLPVSVIFSEMPLYFGYSYNKLEEYKGNKLFAAIYIVFFFALQHSFIPLLPDVKYMLFRFLSFIPLLIVLMIIYRKKKNLIPIMIGHGILDLGTAIQILVSSL